MARRRCAAKKTPSDAELEAERDRKARAGRPGVAFPLWGRGAERRVVKGPSPYLGTFRQEGCDGISEKDAR